MKRVWTAEDEAELRLSWGGDVTDIAKSLVRTPRATQERARILGLTRSRFNP